jgi:putative tricarboxylic transport membrane protein
VLEIIGSALVSLLTGWHLFYLLVGVLVGLMVGILPGLGGIAGMSILLPFLYGMDPVSALGMLIGMVAVVPTGDTFTSILMGIPGSSASQATILDGFPLAKKGQAARALSAAFLSSMIGGVVGALVLTVFVVVARPLILLFTSAELFMLTIFGLSMVGVLAGASLWKGIAACGIGLVLGSVGAAPATGEWRMTLGLDYLTDGIPLVVVGLGIFAIPEIIDLLRRNTAIAEAAALGKGWLMGLRDTVRNYWLVLRCSGFGCLIGALPGLGGSVVDWVAYGHAVQTTRDRSQFGKGEIRGVIAPESANNAVQGGALVPTLLFGIPGSGSMAIFLGGMVLLGIQPGVTMVEQRLDLTYTIIWSLAIANVVGAGLCVLVSRHVAYLTTLPYSVIAPFMIMIIFFAAYQATRNWGDLSSLLALGVLGVYMRRFGWPRPPLLIGFVLAPGAETYLYQAIQFYGWAWITRPGVLIIALIIVASVWAGMRLSGGVAEGGSSGAVQSRAPQLVFGTLVAALFAYAIHDTWRWSFLGKVFPLGSALVGLAATLGVVALVGWARASTTVFDTEAGAPRGGRSAAYYLGWLLALLIASTLTGFVIAMVLYVALFLYINGRVAPGRAALLALSALIFLAGMSHLFTLGFPQGLLQEVLEMPWPFN